MSKYNYTQTPVIQVFDAEKKTTDTKVAYDNSKYQTALEAMDNIRRGIDPIRYDGDIIFYNQNTQEVTSFSDILLKRKWTKDDIDIVTAFTMRPIVRYAVEGVIPLEPKGSYFNVCQRICSAKSNIVKTVSTIQELVTAIEDEIGDWDQKIFVKASETVTGKTYGFNVKAGGISPLWLPLLSKAASLPSHQEAAVEAYQCMMAHMYINREQFCSLSIADHELIRAASIVDTLRNAYPGSIQYCRALNSAKDAISGYITGCYKTEKEHNDHAKYLNMKCKKGRNPLVSYTNYNDLAKSRFEDRGKSKSRDKYGKLTSYERNEINKLFKEAKDCSASGSIQLFNDGFKLSGNRTQAQKKSFVRVKLPTFLKSDGNYVEITIDEGFGQTIRSFRFTQDSFKETRTNKSWINKGVTETRLKTQKPGFVSVYSQEGHNVRNGVLTEYNKTYNYELEIWKKAKQRRNPNQKKSEKKEKIEEKEDIKPLELKEN